MAKDKAAKAGKAPKAGKEPKAGKAPKAKAPKRKGALMDKVTNLVAVLFGVSLVAQRLVGG